MSISFKIIFNKCKSLLINPKSFWVEKKDGLENQGQLLFGFFFPLLFFVAVAVFLGEFFRSTHFYIGFALLKTLRTIVLFVLQYYLAVFFTKELMKTFGGEKNVPVARNLVVFSMSPFLIVSTITGLFPFLYVIDILGVYSFYIFWIGVQETLEFPENKKSSYALITILVTFFIFSFLSVFLSKLLTAYY